mmetsp:Transcript_19565/g.32167  ORF Transcript_19565/g.32167 Transcript_19565/m.32167 type:complete len:801 (-) Transcript_19565:50-2452(-)
MKYFGFPLALCAFVWNVKGDIYMHNPRGSNNRNCENNGNRNNANRLFDSQNNNAGGYACPRAYPFSCYKYTDPSQDADKTACNNQNTAAGDGKTDKTAFKTDGSAELVHPNAVNTPRMYYHEGSIIPIEWTNQHGSGTNSKVHSEIIIQVACQDDEPGIFSFTDDCGTGGGPCFPRDGTPISNQDTNENTKTIDNNPEDQDNYQHGRMESWQFYQFCTNVSRNKLLFTADQLSPTSSKTSARSTRQNPNGNRYGLECPEERDYYPWWNPSPWMDIAVVTSNVEKCNKDVLESQNIVDKGYCKCTTAACTGSGKLPNNEGDCSLLGGEWTLFPAWNKKYGGIQAPKCVAGAFSRDNHLGNVMGNGQTYSYNWTVPGFLAGKKNCALRIRYNISSSDKGSAPLYGDFQDNGKLEDRDKNPDAVFIPLENLCESGEQCSLGHAINTDQIGRTFQDRSYMFDVRPAPSAKCEKIHNLNVRGKRGNIVQVYPSVEYDFSPNNLVVSEDDCVHVQWTGTDYGPARDPNNGEGGPPDPTNENAGRGDRTNMVQLAEESDNFAITDASQFSMFDVDRSMVKRLAFIDQKLGTECQSRASIKLALGDQKNNDDVDRDYRNCAKLSGAVTPYFDAGVLKPKVGTHRYFSSRNNNFSNRGQKGVLVVTEGSGLGAGAIAGIVIGSVAGVALLAFAGILCIPKMKKRTLNDVSEKENLRGPTSLGNTAGAAYTGASAAAVTSPIGSAGTATALYDHSANEAGELSFAKGDKIHVISQDQSGWWEGRLPNGIIGVFPSNYVVLDEQPTTFRQV